MPKIAVFKHSTVNLGDDVQRLVLESLLPRVDIRVDRSDIESINNLDEDTLLVVNGWFSAAEYRWQTKAKCLYVGFHIDDFIIPPSCTVGCRDLHTLGVCQRHNVPAYLSYCPTLLNKNENQKRSGVLFVDVHPKYYSQIPEEIVQNASKLTQYIDWRVPFEDRTAHAKRLLSFYQRAELVVTSRLHTSLPCVAIGVPVVFTSAPYQPYRWQGFENFVWNLDNVARQISAPSREISWIHIPPRLPVARVQEMMVPFKKTLNDLRDSV